MHILRASGRAIIVLAVAGVLAAPVPATAATVSVGVLEDVRTLGFIDYRARPGERNDVAVVRFSAGVYRVVDAAGLVAGAGCIQQGPVAAVCFVGEDEAGAVVRLGDGDDRLAYAGARPDEGATIEDGPGNDVITGSARDDTFVNGPGDDVLRGEAGDDDLQGGPGADRLIGGEGQDTVRYDNRRMGVRADLQGDADDGAPGEGDQIASDVENLVGGSGQDRLTGNRRANDLDGGRGADLLFGRAGADEIEGGEGGDRIVGGSGRDDLSGDRGRDRIEARDGRRDVIRCDVYLKRGDVAVVDRRDQVSTCAVVRRG
ncbi:MAG: calcium-binding protein [Solirubrobacteraceae bacterium]